jgi:hypothetical protein
MAVRRSNVAGVLNVYAKRVEMSRASRRSRRYKKSGNPQLTPIRQVAAMGSHGMFIHLPPGMYPRTDF